MDKQILDGTFSTVSSMQRGESALLLFEDDRPILHIDENIRGQIELANSRDSEISGYTRMGQSFSAEFVASYCTNGRLTLVLDDLVVGPIEKNYDNAVKNSTVKSVVMFCDQRSLDGFFLESATGFGYAIDGVGIKSSNLDSIINNFPATGNHEESWIPAVSVMRRSQMHEDIGTAMAGSDQERLCIILTYENEASLAGARRHVSIIQSLIDAVGRPGEKYLHDLGLVLKDPDSDSTVRAEWWSSVILRRRSEYLNIGNSSPRIPSLKRQSRIMMDLSELGGLRAIQQWILLCEKVPHLLSVLNSREGTVAIDSRAEMLSLAVGWEHLAAYSRGTARSAAWREIYRVLSESDGEDVLMKKMIEMCWNTYLKIKHVELAGGGEDARVAIDDNDVDSLDLAAEFMYHTVLAGSFSLAGLRLPPDFDRYIHFHEASPYTSRWVSVVNKYYGVG